MILIIGNSVDALGSVIKEVNKLSNEEILFFRADLCLEDEGISFSYQNGVFKVFADINGESFDVSKTRKGWFWKPMMPKVLRDYQPYKDDIFMHQQFTAVWRSLTTVLPNAKWLNDYSRMLEAEHKPYQIKKASQIGFPVPDTLITSSPERALNFWKHCQKQVVMKTLAVNPIPQDVVFTNQVTEEVMQSISRIKSAPVILQKLIPPKQELRVTVVGQKVFAATVESESEIDWRRGLVKANKIELPKEICSLCINLISSLGLNFGCIDLIVDHEDKYYFLEVNPNGQWRFIEERAGLSIGEAIAHLLVT